MKLDLDIEEIRRKILPILQPYGVKKIGLFGSCVRGEIRKNSDRRIHKRKKRGKRQALNHEFLYVHVHNGR